MVISSIKCVMEGASSAPLHWLIKMSTMTSALYKLLSPLSYHTYIHCNAIFMNAAAYLMKVILFNGCKVQVKFIP